ncbi:MAG: thioredoxin family protein [Deltaproteobacteria bacterium]|nr:thioredoxin family protein [Deltaproteobacteria bacterium]
MRTPLLPLCLTLVACASAGTTPVPPVTTDAPATPALIEDDWPAALTRGKSLDRPVFVDMWAPWCHSCLALKAEVLTDPALAPIADDFVWAALDSERASSADFIARFPLPALPTLWVIDPRSETPIVRWVGTMTAPQLVELLADARAAYRGHGEALDATASLLEGDAKAAAGDHDAAIAAWRRALDSSPADWPKRGRAANALAFALARAGRNAECAALALAELPRTAPRSTGRADLAIGGVGCAAALEGEAKASALAVLVPEARAIAEDPAVLGDDRSGAWIGVIDGLEALGDKDGAAKAAAAWSALLDDLAARAPSPAARVIYDSHRMSAYLEIGQGERALPMLERSQRDFPNDYNPPARLAYTLLQLGRLDEALAASARAEALVYGPRSLRVLSVRADILEKRGDAAGAIAAIDRALAVAASLPEAQRPARLVKTLSDRRAALAATSPVPAP